MTLPLAFCALLSQAPVPASVSPAPDPGPSMIALPIRIDLGPAFRSVENAAPKIPPGNDIWTPLASTPGTVYRYNLYRDPLMFYLNKNSILVRTTANYYLDVGLQVGRFTRSVGSCGHTKEDRRKIMLGTRAEVSVTPNWSLQLKASLEDPVPVSPCVITFLNYDITSKVVSGMKDNLLKATAAMEQMVRDSALLRQKAESLWVMASHPIPITEGVWLSFHPEKIRLAPFANQGHTLIITPEIQARPSITLGPEPVPDSRALPPLETCPMAQTPGFKVRVEADLSFQHATEQLRKQLAGKRFDTEKGSFEILDIAVFAEKGSGGKAAVSVHLKGKITGKLTLLGYPIYDEAKGTLQLQDLEYSLESRSWITQFGEWLLRSTLKKTLQEKANWFMDKSLNDLRASVEKGLNRPLAQGVAMKGALQALKLSQPTLLPDRFRVNALLEGQVQIDVDAGGMFRK